MSPFLRRSIYEFLTFWLEVNWNDPWRHQTKWASESQCGVACLLWDLSRFSFIGCRVKDIFTVWTLVTKENVCLPKTIKFLHSIWYKYTSSERSLNVLLLKMSCFQAIDVFVISPMMVSDDLWSPLKSKKLFILIWKENIYSSYFEILCLQGLRRVLTCYDLKWPLTSTKNKKIPFLKW